MSRFTTRRAAAQTGRTSAGRASALVPTISTMTVEGSGRFRSENTTLALEDDGEWDLMRVDDPTQVALLRKVCPDMAEVAFAEGTMESVECTLRLHCFGESGNSYKAALALELSGLAWEPVFLDFFGGAARTSDWRAENVMGEAPLLVDGDLHLSQSGAIQAWISERTGKFAGAPEDRFEVLRWVLWDNHKLSSAAGMTRFLMNFLSEDKRPAEVIDFTRGRLRAAYATLNAHLEGRDWIVGDGVTNADLSCCGYLYYPEPFGFERADWPQIDAWLDRISALPGWKPPYDLMPGRPSDRQ